MGGTKTYDSATDKTTVVFTTDNLGASAHGGYYLQVRHVENVYGEDLTTDDGVRRSYRIAYYASELSEQRTASLMFDHTPTTIGDRIWRLYNDVVPGKYSDNESPQTSGRLRLDQILADRYALQVDPFEDFDESAHQWSSSHEKHAIISSNMAKAIQSVALRQGAVIMWNGSITGSNMPRGYAPCDGGTYRCADGVSRTVPDLRGRFVVGAGYGSSDRVAASLGGTGGSMGGSLTAELGGHCISKHEVPPHSHGMNFQYFHHTHTLTNADHSHQYSKIEIGSSGTELEQEGEADGSRIRGVDTATAGPQAGGAAWAPITDMPTYQDGTQQPGPAGHMNVSGSDKTNRTGPGNGGDDSAGNQGNYHAHAMSPNSDDRRRTYQGQSLGNIAGNSLGRGTGSGIAHAHFHGIKLSIAGSSSGDAPDEGQKHPSSTGGSNPYGSATVSLPTTPPYYAMYYIYKL